MKRSRASGRALRADKSKRGDPSLHTSESSPSDHSVQSKSALRESPALLQIREAAQILMAAGKPAEAFAYFEAALAAVMRKNDDLERLLEKLRKQQVGTRSERIAAQQLTLLIEDMRQLGENEPELLAEAQQESQFETEFEAARQNSKPADGTERRGRNWYARQAKRQMHHVTLPAEERRCAECGREQRCIGQDISHVLEYVPAHFVEHEYRRDKYACATCKSGVSTAPAPPKVLARSAADASVLAHIVVSKHVDHTPLHRLRRQYDRCGVAIPVSTLADWAAGVAERVEPLVDLLAARVQRAHVVRTDSTGLKVLDPNSPVNIERGTFWCYVGDDRDVVFRYTPTGEGASGPWEFLSGRHGYIQADAATVFDRLFNGQAASALEVGCWAHARRRFVQLADTDCRVAYPLQLIRRIYRLEDLADLKQLTSDERTDFRKERSKEALDKLKRWLVLTVTKEPPSSDLYRACAYCINQWTALTRFLDDGRLSLDNNLCEQQLRDVALGRKNFLFAGSHEAARRGATLYSLMRTCAQHGVAPLPYLADVLRRLASGWPRSELSELLPDRWPLLHTSD